MTEPRSFLDHVELMWSDSRGTTGWCGRHQPVASCVVG